MSNHGQEKYNETPEGRFYNAVEYKDMLMDQVDAVHTLIDPDIGTSLGLETLQAIKIAATIDPELHHIDSAADLIFILKERIETTMRDMERALMDMRAYPDDVKADILPDLQERYIELDEQLEHLVDDKLHGVVPAAISRKMTVLERELNDMCLLIEAHE